MTSRQPSTLIPERFLRQLWKHQYFKTLSLSTIDGRPVTVLSPGIVNADAGPDFLEAVVRIGNTSYRGDVELHQSLDEWTQHAHNTDSKYNRVILHVVFEVSEKHLPSVTKSKRVIPILVLSSYLAGPLSEIWQRMILDERSERLAHIKCYSVNNGVPSETIRVWLHTLAVERMELKVRRFEDRLKELADKEQQHLKEPLARYGTIPFGLNPEDLPVPTVHFAPNNFSRVQLWNQLLYEGVMDALGYAKNRQPFLRLARNVPLDRFRNFPENFLPDSQIVAIEAFLFGASGLLDLDLRRANPEGKRYAQQLRSMWKTIQRSYRGETLHQTDWQFFRLRPENFPTVRLAGMARLIPKMLSIDFFKFIIQTMKNSEANAEEKFYSLQSEFIVPTDQFWSTHFRFDDHAKSPSSNLIGKNRAGDIILNVLLPVSLLYARVFKDKEVREGSLNIFDRCQPLSGNTITRTMEKELLKGKLTLDSALCQQGVLQLYKFYCVEERCKECAIGKITFRS